MTEKPKWGIVLSGGAARGFAHLGVLQALNENHIYPGVISGASAGSIVGAFYADGYKPYEIFDIFSRKRFTKFLELSMPSKGFLKITGLERILKSYLRAKLFEDLKIPLHIAVTNFSLGKIEYWSKGDLVMAVIASASIPVVFQAIEIGSTVYVDGGVMDNLPLTPIENTCEKVIGVHVNPLGEVNHHLTLLNIIERTFLLMATREAYRKIDNFDIFIEPLALKKFLYTDVSKGQEMFDIGYNETMKVLQANKLKN